MPRACCRGGGVGSKYSGAQLPSAALVFADVLNVVRAGGCEEVLGRAFRGNLPLLQVNHMVTVLPL